MREVRSFLSCLVHRKGDQHEASSGYHIRASRTKPGDHWRLGTALVAGALNALTPFLPPPGTPLRRPFTCIHPQQKSPKKWAVDHVKPPANHAPRADTLDPLTQT